MYLDELQLQNFRNYDSLKIKFNSHVNIIYGNNAQGKTNLLESIYVLGLTKSHLLDNNLIQNGKNSCKIKGIVKKNKFKIKYEVNYLDDKRAEIKFDLPLIEVVYDFYDKLKSISRGYASFDYDFSDFRESQIEKIDILVHGEVVDALSFMAHRSNAESRGRQIIEKLKHLIPKHMFQIPLQAAIGGRIIARENISALRKNVTAKCYGGDITRKRKLLEKQKEGKKRMKAIGNVEIPQDAFISVLKTDDNNK